MWSSLFANLRDVFAPVKQPPLQLTSKPIEGTVVEAEGSMWSSLAANLRDVFNPVKQPPLQLTSKPIQDDLILEEEPVWKTLGAGIQDLFFPKKLPPLELTSKPVPVKDILAVKRGALSWVPVAGVIILGIAALILFWREWRTRPIIKQQATTQVDVAPYIPKTAKLTAPMGGGGGGGDHDLVDVSKGKLPKIAKEQIQPPQVIRNDHPKLPVQATIVVQPNVKLPDANMPDLGLPSSKQVQLASNGTGTGGGMGSGGGGGLGSGSGPGFGPGRGGGTGGGLYHVGGGVSAPVLLYSVDPDFSDEARRAKYQGACVVEFIVDTQGNPQNIRVVRPLGMGLDEKAIQAVRQYRFKPAMLGGKPVPVAIQIEVDFHIY